MNATALEAIRAALTPLRSDRASLDRVLHRTASARFVLIGEASHGTQDFYRVRAELTKRLIVEHGFTAVAVEADWPDAFLVNRFVRDRGHHSTAAEALSGFQRFPRWMWRNHVVAEFVAWLRARNDDLGQGESKAGFYGLDLYSLHASINAVVAYLDEVDPAAAQRARRRYACFEHFGQDPQAYGYLTTVGDAEPCADEVVGQLVELQRRSAELAMRDGRVARDEFFSAEQNARLAANAEAYYRSMFAGRASSWNLRDRHMADTLDELARHLSERGEPARIVVWAHNSHLGDARATSMSDGGEFNLGQLMRERHPRQTCLIGMSTYHGEVTAASDWGAPAERKRVRPGLPDSHEELLHQVAIPAFSFSPTDDALIDALAGRRLQRAIGVIYRPETERWSHYYEAELPRQFDLMIHLDRTSALVPLERKELWDAGELPETFPTGE